MPPAGSMRPGEQPPLPTGTVTFLFTDIEGSTRLVSALGDAYRAVLEAHAGILRSAIAIHGGIELATEGDSLFAVFPSAREAVRAAAEAQAQLAAHEWPAGASVRVRMGVHTGEGRLGGDNYVGLDVHRAARIAAAGHGGQLLLSDATRGLVAGDLAAELSLRDLGLQRLKDLPWPERLWQVDIPGLAAEFPPPRSLDARPNNLPVSLTPLIGRRDELRRVAELLQGRRLLTLTGPGGSGKTRLALAAAGQLLSEFADGVFFVGLENAYDRTTVAAEIAAALDVRESPERELELALKQTLRDRKVLVVLDNFEQVIVAAPLVAELLAAAEGLRVIVTSRSVLHLSGEQRLDVPPLALPDPRHLPPLASLSQYEAVALFIERARAVRPDFEVTNENAPAVAEICARLDGLPLAIELAAARMKLLTPQAALERLERRLPLLAGGATDLPERQRTLRGAVEWSYGLLDERERRMFGRLSVFAGGWELDAAEAVCNPDDELGLDTLDGIQSQADSSLIQVREEDAEPRFSMLQVIREFALDKLEAGPDADAIRRRHAVHMLALAEEAGPTLTSFEARRWQARLRREEENIRTALRWALDADAAEVGLGTASAIWRYWHYWSALREGRRWLEALLQLPSARGTTPARAGALDALAALVYWLGLADDADARYAEALDAYRQLGNEQRAAEIVEASTLSAVAGGKYELALERAHDGLARFNKLGDRAGVARLTAWLKTVPFLTGTGGTADEALAATHEAIQQSRQAGNALDIADWQGTLVTIYRQMGDIERAIEAFEVTTRMYAELEYQGMLPWLKLLARMEIDRGRVERGVRLAAIAARSVEELGGELPEEMMDAGDPLGDGRKLMADEDFSRTVAEGRAMSFEEAVAYVLDGDAVEGWTPRLETSDQPTATPR